MYDKCKREPLEFIQFRKFYLDQEECRIYTLPTERYRLISIESTFISKNVSSTNLFKSNYRETDREL